MCYHLYTIFHMWRHNVTSIQEICCTNFSIQIWTIGWLLAIFMLWFCQKLYFPWLVCSSRPLHQSGLNSTLVPLWQFLVQVENNFNLKGKNPRWFHVTSRVPCRNNKGRITLTTLIFKNLGTNHNKFILGDFDIWSEIHTKPVEDSGIKWTEKYMSI